MPDESFFDSLKSSIVSAKEAQMDIGEQRRILKRIMLITDGYDDFMERIQLADEFAGRHGAEVKRVFLYDISSFLKQKYSLEQFKENEHALVEALREHANAIRTLKEQNVSIILDDTVKNLLISLREIRQNEDEEQFKTSEVSALTDFLLGDLDRERNLSNALVEVIQNYRPQVIYFKPPLLSLRESESRELSFVTERVLKGKPNGTWVYMRGDKGLKDVKKATILMLGGQDMPEIMRAAHAVNTLFPKMDIKLNYFVLMDRKKENMAKLMSDLETQEDVRNLLSKKIKDIISNVRYHGSLPETEVVYGEIESQMLVSLREMETDLLFISPKFTSENQFDEELLDVIVIAVNAGISVFVTY